MPLVDQPINPRPSLIMYVPLSKFHVEKNTLRGAKISNRLFNEDVQLIGDKEGEYDRYFQINILGTDLKFMFERDQYRRILNVVKLNGNLRPEPGQGRTVFTTFAASANGIEFLVHRLAKGDNTIVGASAPPNQVVRNEEEKKRIRLEAKGISRTKSKPGSRRY